jgi:hypothetical protein
MALNIAGLTQEVLVEDGGALGGGILLGFLAQKKPTWATGMVAAAAVVGVLGSLAVRGTMSSALQGVGAGALGIIGYSVPGWMGTGRTGGGRERSLSVLNAQRALGMRDTVNSTNRGTVASVMEF